MTFLEAAIEILRHEREPIHFAEITKRAVDRKLLSHVGRDPETAMQTCLNSAVRTGLMTRDKPGHFQLRPGADLPELPVPPGTRAAALGIDKKPGKINGTPLAAAGSGEGRSGEGRSASKGGSDDGGSDDEGGRGRKKKSTRAKKKAAASEKVVMTKKKSARRRAKPVEAEAVDEIEETEAEETEAADETEADETEADETEAEAAASDSADAEAADDDDDEDDDEAPAAPRVPEGTPPLPALDPSKIRFRGPQGSGLEGETDIALVMANAVSRLVHERPELRSELEAMQRTSASSATASTASHPSGMSSSNSVEVIEVRKRVERRDDRKDALDDDRGGRRRRRRRRRARRLEWSEGGAPRANGAGHDELLDKVAQVLGEAGARSLHIRQIAEQLAAQNVLGGEISEIERAVTAALLLDVHRRGDVSRFAVRGDARYQLRGARVPDKAAAAEQAARRALLALEQESERQLLQWLQTLGARSLEALVRVWLDREEHAVVATLAPGRGLGKLIVEDPEADDEEGRLLVLIVPRKTPVEPKLWEGEAERNGCTGILLFAMGEVPELGASGPEPRIIGAAELTRWLIRQRIGIRVARFEVPVLDADLIESIAGLDT
jgi:hypothetical protein